MKTETKKAVLSFLCISTAAIGAKHIKANCIKTKAISYQSFQISFDGSITFSISFNIGFNLSSFNRLSLYEIPAMRCLFCKSNAAKAKDAACWFGPLGT